MFTAVLDTSVLWPSLQRDFLLSLAVEGLYRPVWSAAILAELEEHEAAKLRRRGTEEPAAGERARRLVAMMRQAFADAEVTGWEPLEGTFGLPDPDDEHVLAAAVIAGAGAVVTSNLRDFPAGEMPEAIEVLPPAAFAANTVALNPSAARRAIAEIAARSGRHGQQLDDAQLRHLLVIRYGMDTAMEYLR